MNLKKILAATLLCVSAVGVSLAGEPANFNIIPAPQSLIPGSGFFTITPTTKVCGPKVSGIASMLAEKLSRATGYSITTARKIRQGGISLVINKDIKGDEAYRLTVTPQAVKAEASTPHGLWNAVTSFLQLLPPQVESQEKVSGVDWKAASCTVTDAPRFAYRGVLIDVCRHFFTIDQLKHHIDMLSLYKINNLHLHLTEDQGWRVEIKKYPKLTEVGAWRDGDHGKYGGYYTQDQLRDLVKYASDRYINIVPEFEMPGHELAAIASYPWLSCRGEQVKPRTIWGVEPIVMCPGKETTFKFLQDVVDELVKIFPSKYFHIGGDEAPRQEWAKCPRCQHLADSLGLKAENGRSREAQLQSYIIERMEKYLGKYGKSIIGWDEILEGGNLNKTAIVMSWRGEQGGIAAANAGHRVIMTPSTNGCYLDFYQGDPSLEPVAIGGYAPLSTTYSYDAVPSDVAKKGMEKYVLGVQGNLWAEYLSDNAHQDYMLYPRILAIAETGWTAPENKDFKTFAGRVDNDAAVRMHLHKVNFHIPLPEQKAHSCDYEAFTDKAELAFLTTRPEKMVYTLDGTEPVASSTEYTAPLTFTESATLKIRTVLPSGLMSRVRTVNVVKETLSPASTPASTKPGLAVRSVEGTYHSSADMQSATLWKEGTVTKLDELRTMNYGGRDYGVIAEGYVSVPSDGVYYFLSENPEVWIDGVKVVDNDNNLVRRANTGGRSKALKAGLHKIKVVYARYTWDGCPTEWNSSAVSMSKERGKYNSIRPEDLCH